MTPLHPVPLNHPLLNFQQEALDHALSLPASYIALDMGLGKTAVGIAVAAAAVSAGIKPVAIVVPPSLRINWAHEIHKFAPWLKGVIIKSSHVKDLPNVDIYIVGDSVLTSWEDELKGKVGAIIVDEAHRHKNHSTKRAKALSTIAEGVTGPRVLLSGTPTPNGRHSELAGQLDILGPTAWKAVGGKGRFWSYYCPKRDAFGNRGNHDTAGLHDAMKTFMIRMRREEVITLPNKGRTAIAVEASGKAARDYLRIEDDLIAYLKGEDREWRGAARNEALVRMGMLRHVAGLAKVGGVVDHVHNYLDEHSGGVFLVAEHNDVMDTLGLHIKYPTVEVRGGMDDYQKQDAVDAFTSGRARVMIGQVTAAGVGLTLHGGGLNTRVVVAQLPWTPAELRQAEDRLHRIGQTNDVQVEIMLCALDNRWTIDERLWGVLEQKSFNTGELIDGKGEFLLEDVQTGVLDTYR